MATKPLSDAKSTPEPPKTSAKIGPGGELYGDASTTPDDATINYPDNQDGVAIAPVDPAQIAAPDPDVNQPTDLTAGSPATLPPSS